MGIQVTPIPRLTVLATPAFSLGTANAAGAAVTAVASNSTLLAFDGTTPAAVAGTGAVGSATVAARRDHVHPSVSGAITTVDNNIARYTGTAGALQGYTSGGPTIGDTGIMLKSAQPAVTAYPSSEQSNCTGAGTSVDLVFDTEVFDQGGNWATPTFTAPVTGRYSFDIHLQLGGVTAAMTRSLVSVVTSNRNWLFQGLNVGAIRTDYNTTLLEALGIADLDASDTLKFQLTVYNGAGDTVDIGYGTDSSISICLLV
jgi:hypothetical protein